MDSYQQETMETYKIALLEEYTYEDALEILESLCGYFHGRVDEAALQEDD